MLGGRVAQYMYGIHLNEKRNIYRINFFYYMLRKFLFNVKTEAVICRKT